jgi:transposase InsO family protein
MYRWGVGKSGGKGKGPGGDTLEAEPQCYENACAERLKGILKQEYGRGGTVLSKKQALLAVDEAAFLYNTKQPHLALKYEPPEKMHPRAA